MPNKTKIKKYIIKISFGLAVFGLMVAPLIIPNIVKAQTASFDAGLNPLMLEWRQIWQTWEIFKFEAETPGTLGDEQTALNTTQKNIYDTYMDLLKSVVSTAFKSALGYFLNTIAYDTATWLASGGEGQQPMFVTEGWGEYLKNAGDSAAGVFIEQVGQGAGGGQEVCSWQQIEQTGNKYSLPQGSYAGGPSKCPSASPGAGYLCVCSKEGGWPVKFNLCNPDLSVKVAIGLGLEQSQKPSAPKCTFSQMKKNWENELNNPDFLQNFQASFNPWENDVGIAWSLQTGLLEKKTEEQNLADKKRVGEEAVGNFKSVTENISNKILTPTGLVKERSALMVEEGTYKEVTWVDDPYGIANAISTFANTLIGKLSQRLFDEGLAILHGENGGGESNGYSSGGVYSYEGEGGLGGTAAAQMRFAEFLEAGFAIGGSYEVIQQLTMCPDPNKPGVTDCVIDERFRQAIENGTQVRNLDPDILKRPFGVVGRESKTGEALEPSYKEGFPLRSLIILRKYRIVPVGWELAAQYISQFDDKTYNLGDLVAINDPKSGKYDQSSVFFGLVDPNWVLTAPENYCRRKGPGPDVVMTSLEAGYDKNKDGDYEDPDDTPPKVSLYRNENYCADEQSCIVENDNGSCRFYGYCTEEKRTWNFSADTCQQNFNTCQTFTGQNGVTASYLKNTLNYNSCNVDNAGCWWYCRDYDVISGNWACAAPGKSYTKCVAPGGCIIKRECDIPLGGNSCYAEEDGSLLVSTVTCNESWCKGKLAGSSCPLPIKCEFTVWGSIPYDATQVTVPACSGAGNLLANSSFEDGTGWDASNWTENTGKTNNDNAYQRRIKKSEAQSGSYVLESYATASSGSLVTTSKEIKVTADKKYIVSGWIYNNLNSGAVYININSNGKYNSKKCTGIPANGSKEWSKFFCEFKPLIGASSSTVSLTVSPLLGGNINGTVWFDDIELQENCLGQAVTIYNGAKWADYTTDNLNNDIYFDGQAESCNAQSNGCSELIRTQAGLGTNLTVNSSFEDFEGTAGDEINDKFKPWFTLISVADKPLLSKDQQKFFAGNEPLFGKSAIKVPATSSGNSGLYQEIKLGTPATGRIFSFSFWAKRVSGSDPGNLKFFLAEDADDAYSNKLDTCLPHIFAEGFMDMTAERLVTGEWQRFSTFAVLDNLNPKHTLEGIYNGTYKYCSDNVVTIRLWSDDADILVDGVQFEELNSSQLESQQLQTDYKDYGSVNQTYLKKPPAYYNCQGYTAGRPGPKDDNINNLPNADLATKQGICLSTENRVWKNNLCYTIDPAICSQFTQLCFPDEISCQWYAPLNGDPKVPAVVKYPDDYCPAECAGYQTYKQEPTYFEQQGVYPLHFISGTAKQCSAQQAGCDEFTNLDEVAKGGEGREYYTYLRECQKPAPANDDCATYYTWMGSDVNGYQLQVYQLKKSSLGGGQAPCTNLRYVDGIAKCGDDWIGVKVAACTKDDTLTNPDCREFYDASGKINYRLYSHTISCSDDCHPYRKTVAQKDYCEGSGGYWNANSECIYYAIPKEGISCPASAAGCRAYTGNAGKNVMNVLFDTFESGTNDDWQGGTISNESVMVAGHSLAVEGAAPVLKQPDKIYGSSGKFFSAAKPTGSLTHQNGTYLLEFWAKSKSVNGADLVAGFVQLNSAKSAISQYKLFNDLKVKLTPQWHFYSFGPVTLDWQTNPDLDYLAFVTNGAFYLDNILLKEVTDNIFVIRDSWKTPVSCDNDYFDPAGNNCQGGSVPDPKYPRCIPQAMLGCEGYRDKNNQTLYLKSFDHLCREEAVGCEAFIDTYNSSTPFEKIYNQGDNSEIKVPADQTILLVNDKTKTCESKDKGCLGLGRPTLDQNDKVTSFQTTYLKSDPDKYDSIMCLAPEVGCDEYTTGLGSYYFKDPGNKVCDHKAPAGASQKSWYKRGTDEQCNVTTSQLGIEYPAGACITGKVGLACAPEKSGMIGYACNDGFTHCSGIMGKCAAPSGYLSADPSPRSCANSDGCLLAAFKDNNNNGVNDAGDTLVNGACEGYKLGVCVGNACSNNDSCQMKEKKLTPNGEAWQTTEATKNNYCTKWAGICPANQSGCTEFIDPVSNFAKNLIFNGSFEQNVDSKKNIPDAWTDRFGGQLKKALIEYGPSGINNSQGVRVAFGGGVNKDAQNFYQQDFLLEPNTLYTLSINIKKYSLAHHAIVGLYNCHSVKDSANNQFNKPKGVNSPDDSMIVAEEKNEITGDWYNHMYFLVNNNQLDNNQYLPFSGRFFSGDLTLCEGLVFGAVSCQPNKDGKLKCSNPALGSHWFDDIALRETGIYYKINSEKLDKTSCNGQVDFNKGCVLFNDRSAINWQEGEGENRYLVFDADQSPAKNGAPKTKCDSNPNDNYSEQCDANMLLKVTPDRTCDEWLYCQSSVATINDQGEKENMCFDVGLCNSVDDQGKCDSTPLIRSNQISNQTYTRGNVDQLKNLSGYSKAGFDWSSDEVIEGDYPVYQMKQYGNLAGLSNGDFELSDGQSQPTGWSQAEDLYETKEVDESMNWDPSYFKVVDDPIEAADNGVCYKSTTPCMAPQGKNFLKLNGIYMADSEFISVTQNIPYVISFNVNSHWLSAGETGVLIFEYNDQSGKTISKSGVCVPATPSIFLGDSKIPSPVPNPCNTDDECSSGETCKNWSNVNPLKPGRTQAGQEWEYKVLSFTTHPGTTKIKVKLYNYLAGEPECLECVKPNKATGSTYFDNIQIKSTLQTKDIKVSKVGGTDPNDSEIKPWYTTRSCRLYPDKSSLSCAYTDDKGAQYKGWQGYCLEHDRGPGNTDSCLLWWPVDIIQGEYWGPDFGYNDRYPLYYCLAASENNHPEGVCAYKTTDANTYYSYQTGSASGEWCPSGGLANCAGCVLGGATGAVIVDFGTGIVNGGDPNDPADPYALWNQGIPPGYCADNSQCIDPEKDGIGTCKDSGEKCYWFDNEKYGKRWDLQLNASLTACGYSTAEVLVSSDLKNWISVGTFHSGAGQVKGEGWNNCYDAMGGNCCPNGGCPDGQGAWRCGCIDKGNDLTFQFDFKGTAAVTGIYRYVKVLSKGFDNPQKCSGVGPAVGGLMAFHLSPSCEWLSQVVTPSGDNKAWLARINAGSNYTTADGHIYSNDYPPFGGIVPPEPVGNPPSWDSRDNADFPGKQQLYQEPPDKTNYQSPYQTRAGAPYVLMNTIDPTKGKQPSDGAALVQRLFAESYGTWKWGGQGKCVNSSKDGQDCNRDDCPGGSCEVQTHCSKNDQKCEVTGCGSNGKGIYYQCAGLSGGIATCQDGPNKDKLCCPSNFGVCGQLNKDDNKYYGVCSENSEKFGENCQEDVDCCKDPKNCQNSKGFCQAIAFSQCLQGTNDGKSCFVDDCPGGACDFADLRYYASAQPMWSPPTNQCTKDSGSLAIKVFDRNEATNPNTNYCAIPPVVDNIKVNGKGNGEIVELVKGGFVTLTFTSQIDPNQLPITGYTIDWGDGNITQASGIKINQNPSADNPHTFYHYYSYWDIKSRVGTQSGGLSSCSANSCGVVLKIMVVDNWGWCNGQLPKGTCSSKSSKAGEKCYTDIDCPGGTCEDEVGYYGACCSTSGQCKSGIVYPYKKFGGTITISER